MQELKLGLGKFRGRRQPILANLFARYGDSDASILAEVKGSSRSESDRPC